VDTKRRGKWWRGSRKKQHKKTQTNTHLHVHVLFLLANKLFGNVKNLAPFATERGVQ
jgi:hypothetical protein